MYLLHLRDTLTEVYFCANYLCDESLEILAQITSLEVVNISQDSNVTGKGCREVILALSCLRCLKIARTEVSKEGVSVAVLPAVILNVSLGVGVGQSEGVSTSKCKGIGHR